MKKVILVLMIILFLPIKVNAFCFFGIGDCKRIVGINPVFDEKDSWAIQRMNIKEIVEFKAKDIERGLPKNILKVALPIVLEIDATDGNKFFVSINNNGFIRTLNSADDSDVIISGREYQMKELFYTRMNEELIKRIIELDITPLTYKGKVISQIVEDYIGVKIVHEKSRSQKMIGIVTKPVVGAINLFH